MLPQRKDTYIDVFMLCNNNICPCEKVRSFFLLPHHMAYDYLQSKQ